MNEVIKMLNKSAHSMENAVREYLTPGIFDTKMAVVVCIASCIFDALFNYSSVSAIVYQNLLLTALICIVLSVTCDVTPIVLAAYIKKDNKDRTDRCMIYMLSSIMIVIIISIYILNIGTQEMVYSNQDLINDNIGEATRYIPTAAQTALTFLRSTAVLGTTFLTLATSLITGRKNTELIKKVRYKSKMKIAGIILYSAVKELSNSIRFAKSFEERDKVQLKEFLRGFDNIRKSVDVDAQIQIMKACSNDPDESSEIINKMKEL